MPTPASTGRLTSRPSASPAAVPLPPGVHALDDVGLPGTLLHVPAGVDGPRPLVVFFHGAGGEAARSLPVVEPAVERHGVLALVPTSAASTWDLLVGTLGRDVAALDAALEHVLARHAVDRVALAGFSDGGSYALSLGLANGDVVGAVLALSPGFAAPPAQVGAPRVWVQHGVRDTVLPVDRCGRRVARTLRDAGYDVRYEEFDGGHVLPPALVAAGFDWWLSGA